MNCLFFFKSRIGVFLVCRHIPSPKHKNKLTSAGEPNALNKLPTSLIWTGLLSHVAHRLPLQRLSKQPLQFHMERPPLLRPHWSRQAWKPPLSQSAGIWGANATNRRRNLCDSRKQLTTHFASSAHLLPWLPSFFSVLLLTCFASELGELTTNQPPLVIPHHDFGELAWVEVETGAECSLYLYHNLRVR